LRPPGNIEAHPQWLDCGLISSRTTNEQRPHQGRWCFGKTPMQTFLAAMPMTQEKVIAA